MLFHVSKVSVCNFKIKMFIYRLTYRQTDTHTHTQTDKQTDKHTDNVIYIYIDYNGAKP